jgi:dTDP-glucose 4,6-dehydratase
VIPTIISQALTRKTIYLGNVEARRDLTYISDTVDGFLKVALTPDLEGATINLGSGSEVSIAQLVREIQNILGKDLEVEVETERLRPEKSEVQRLLSDNRLAQESLGWEPKVSLEEGLRMTVDWIMDHLERYPEEYQV